MSGQAARRLLEVLGIQNRLIETLISLGQEETRALLNDDWASLQEITERQNQTAGELEEAENLRQQTFALLAVERELPATAKLTEIIEGETLSGEELRQLGHLLAANVLKLKDLNETNTLLLRQSLTYVQKMLNLITVNNQTYGSGGSLKKETDLTRLNRTV